LHIYTIGHSTRELKDFIKILHKYQIKTIIDVRRFPKSGKFPHFNKENLEKELPRKSVEYIWLGELLGGFRKGGYEKYTRTSEFREGIERVTQFSKEATATVMCTEALWFKCHRRYITEELSKLGFKVIHIIEEGRIYEHKPRRRKRKLENTV
jgi:uncharacterized protein (DUF488 family)